MQRVYVLCATVVALTVLTLFFVACQPIQPVAASSVASQPANDCSLATLKGRYGMIGQGQILTSTNQQSDPVGLWAAVGPVTYDGAGAFKAVVTISFNGKIIRAVGLNGTYTIKADCTATSLLQHGGYDMVIVDQGREVYAIAAIEGRVYTFSEKRID